MRKQYFGLVRVIGKSFMLAPKINAKPLFLETASCILNFHDFGLENVDFHSPRPDRNF